MTQTTYNVDTNINDREIEQLIGTGTGHTHEVLMRRVLDTGEAEIRAALIRMGWTPPAKPESALTEAEARELVASGTRRVIEMPHLNATYLAGPPDQTSPGRFQVLISPHGWRAGHRP